ncbi:MAG: phosphomannomutase/phosphoglucomutase [Cellvibrionaceae bacterium]
MGDPKTKKPKRTSPKKQLPLITIAALAAVLLLVLFSGFWSYGTWVTDTEQQRLIELSKLQVDKRAADINDYIQDQQQQLTTFANRTSIINALSTTAAENQSVLKGLKTAFPQALSFRLLDLERQDRLNEIKTTDAEASNGLKLSFTELDMINRAEQFKPVPPEARKTQSTLSLQLITPISVKGEQPAIGTLLISLPMKELQERMSSLEPELGQLKLLREAARRPVTVFELGQTLAAGDAQTQKIGESFWLLEFTPSEALAEQAAESPILLLLLHLLIGSALLAATYWLTGRYDPIRARVATKPSPSAATSSATSPGKTGSQDEQDILDIHVTAEDEGLLGLHDTILEELEEIDQPGAETIELVDEIFRAYDIRGLAGTQVTVELAERVGQAVASEALAAGDNSIFVARDGRNLSEELCQAVIRGALDTGCNVINLGRVPTPLLYFATCELSESSSGIMITASHNSAEYNGFKMVIDGRTLVQSDIQNIKNRIQNNDFFQGSGSDSEQQIIPEYIDRIFSDVALAGDVKLVIDAGNGATGEVAPLLFEELGCEVEPLYCDIDGDFPNHDPDPTIEANLQDLIATVESTEADLGVAFDGDGDRLVLVTPKGNIIWPDRLLMLFAKDIVARNPGADVIFDVKCTRELNSLVSSYGGRPIMWKSGHSNMKTKMQETGALLGGELSGHIFIKDRWYGFDDGMYAAARLLEIMTLRDQDIDDLFDSFPMLPSTPELKIPVEEAQKFELIERLIELGDFQNGKAITLDGLRVDFPKGWGLVRASNTSAALTLRFEAESESVLEQLQQLFKRELLKIDESLDIPF